MRPLDQLTSETLVAQGELNSPFFSPDSASVGFYDRRPTTVLKRVSMQGGPASTICDLPGDLRGASWGADGIIVFASADSASGLWRVAAAGGEPEQLTTPEQGDGDHLWPEILPGGEAVLFTITAGTSEETQIAVLSLTTGEQKVLLRGGAYPRYSLTGHLLYGVQADLWAVPFDLSRLEIVGDSVPVQEGVFTKPQGAANVGLSDNGSLIYMPLAARLGSTLVWVDREGREEPLAAERRNYGGLRLSPDGQQAAIVVFEQDNADIVVYDLVRDTPTWLTFDPAGDNFPVWTLDGERVAFSSGRGGGPFNVWWKAADGTGEAERLSTSPNLQFPTSWAGEGQTLVVYTTRPETAGDVGIVSMEGGQAEELLIEEPFVQTYPDVSRDGRWIAYGSSESGQVEVYVRPFPNVDQGKWQISRDGGGVPLWGPDGRELFYRGVDGEMMVVSIDVEPTFNPGNPALVFEAGHLLPTSGIARAFDISPDGQRFLMITQSSPEDSTTAASQINVVLNWHEELLERVPLD